MDISQIEQDWKDIFLKYRDIPEVFFMPHYGCYHQQGNWGVMSVTIISKATVASKIIVHWCNEIVEKQKCEHSFSAIWDKVRNTGMDLEQIYLSLVLW